MGNTMTDLHLTTKVVHYYHGVVRSFDRIYAYDNDLDSRKALNRLVLDFANEINASFTPSINWETVTFYEMISGRECGKLKYTRNPKTEQIEIVLTYIYF